MSQKNGEKSRFQINRKRAVIRRAKIRALVATAAGASGDKAQVAVGRRRAKG
jgi:hypothetical protein